MCQSLLKPRQQEQHTYDNYSENCSVYKNKKNFIKDTLLLFEFYTFGIFDLECIQKSVKNFMRKILDKFQGVHK